MKNVDFVILIILLPANFFDKMILRILLSILLCFALCIAMMANNSTYTANSILSEGRWVKISVKETGFYKLTYAELKKMGFSNPEKVSIHGYGGLPMEEDFTKATYIDDLPAVAIWRGSDYILFYGKGVVKWMYTTNSNAKRVFLHENNAYSTHGYYFVTDITETNEAKIASSENLAIIQVDKYDDCILHEKDEVSITTTGRPYSGRELFGESFDSQNSQSFPFLIPGITDDDGIVSFRFVARVKSGTGIVSLSVNEEELPFSKNTISTADNNYIAALEVAPEVAWRGKKNENTKINISFSILQQTSHLDYIRLQMKRQLQPYGACTFFRSFESESKATQFNIKNASSNILVFDVTENSPMQLMETSLNGSELSFTIPAGMIREFAMVDLSKEMKTPGIVGDVKSQNLHGMNQTDMIILAPDAFVSEAERLAEAHRSYNSLSVAVVTPEQVYNEFSSGTPEVTAIRRFMKMFYDRSTSDTDAPQYLLLFGDGRFDNRKLTNIWKNSSDNYLLTYQSKESIGKYSYVSDDYFGFLSDEKDYNPNTATINLGIGRFPVSTVMQAKSAVDKVIGYLINTNSGIWKNQLCFVADDGNATDDSPRTHMEDSNKLADYIESNHSEFVPKKLFFDRFKRDYSGGKPAYPDIRTNIQKELRDGVLIINYTGHGDAVSWSEEKVMTQADINNATYPNLPLWIVAACDFAPFDSQSTSAGEDVFLNKKSGGIAIFAASRVAWSKPNFRINMSFLENIFRKKNGRHLTLGEVMKNSKNSNKSWGQELKSFVLLGDPALTLAYPDEYNMEITNINGEVLTEDSVNFKAFEKITIGGQIKTPDGALADDFKGALSTTIFDSQQQITTLNNANIGTYTFADYPNTLYIGNDSIRNGEFIFTFSVPKDISYSCKKGKINLYAVDENGKREANGSYKNFTVGGTADYFETDESGPDIRAIYMNTADFKNGDKVNETPLFSAIIWDESGINVGGGSIGHDIILTIDNNPSLSYSLNNYYRTYFAGEDGEGIVKFSIPQLEPGKHTAEFKVWDIHNNSSSQTFSFFVVDNYTPSIIDLVAGPSPARDFVNFMISHDLPESLINVEIQVYDINGRRQWKYEETGSSDMFDAYRVSWNLTNGAGTRLPPGIYIYRVVMKSDKSTEVSKSRKLIILAP